MPKFKKGTIERAANKRGLSLGKNMPPNGGPNNSMREAMGRRRNMKDSMPGNRPMPNSSMTEMPVSSGTLPSMGNMTTSDKLRTLTAIRNSSKK